MTEQTNHRTEPTDDFTLDMPRTRTSIQWEIDRLTSATEAMRLAISAIDRDSDRAWVSGASVLLNAVFRHLAFEVANATMTLKQMLPLHHD